MVGLDEAVLDGQSYVVVQERWKRWPQAIELQFSAAQRKERELKTGRCRYVVELNLKLTPYQLGVLYKLQVDRVCSTADGVVEEIDCSSGGFSKYRSEPGYWVYEIFTNTPPRPDSVVTLRLIPRKSGGDLSQCSLS